MTSQPKALPTPGQQRRQAACDIAEGLARIVSFSDRAENDDLFREGVEILTNGIEEALALLEPSR